MMNGFTVMDRYVEDQSIIKQFQAFRDNLPESTELKHLTFLTTREICDSIGVPKHDQKHWNRVWVRTARIVGL